MDGKGTPCPRPQLTIPTEFTFIPSDEADYIMLLQEMIEVTGRAPHCLDAKDIIGLTINRRAREAVAADSYARKRAEASTTGSAKR